MKLGVVVVNRNDGYKDYERGLIHFKSMLETFDEVNYIDWNSPNGSFLWDIMDDLPKTGKIRHYIMTPEIVKQIIPYPDASKCNETLSRNIAIRRSEADWIVSTSIDIIPPKREDLISKINQLNSNTFYTLSRRELPLSIVEKYTIEQWREMREEVYETIPERHFPAMITHNDHYSLINCCGDFQMAHKGVWSKIKGYEENMIYALFSDSNVQKKAVLEGCGLEAIYSPPVFHIEHKPYSLNEKGERIKSKGFHTESNTNTNNDLYKFMDGFSKTENTDDWGLGSIEIEFEII
jgi:hypothetical protein